MAPGDVRLERITADDEHFLSCFESCSLPESEWTHRAHIRVAWLCLAQDAPDRALGRIRRGILRYNTEVLLRRHNYHETVAVAFARIHRTGYTGIAGVQDRLTAKSEVYVAELKTREPAGLAKGG